jgi:hypothetical protein
MNAWKATFETAVDLFRFRRARDLGIAAVSARVVIAAALGSIPTASALAQASV